MIKILVADDHAPVRRALCLILGRVPSFTVCAEAANGEEAVAMARLHRPHVVVLDLVMPRLGGIETARRILAILPGCEIAIVTMHESDGLLDSAVAAGARAYLLKSDADRHLVQAVRSLAAHRPYFLRQTDAIRHN